MLASRTLRLVLCAAALAGALAAETRITVLATTDLHGNVYDTDYFTGRTAARGLARVAAHIRAVRSENPNTILIDCGDTIQGTPLESVWQYWVMNGRLPAGLTWHGRPPAIDPMMLAMNSLGYDAMVPGNHEFNFSLKNLNAARDAARFPWISANIVRTRGSRAKAFAPYVVKHVAGVKVAIIGLTTPGIPQWEPPENYAGYRFQTLKKGAIAAVAQVRRNERPDIIIAAMHAGLDSADDILRDVPGFDAAFLGHSHDEIKGREVSGVMVVQPKNWGTSLGRVDFTLEREGRRWRIIRRTGGVLPASKVKADPEILALTRPYHEMTEKYLATPVAESGAELDGRFGRIRDTALVDAIHAVQMHYAKADVSFTSLFNTRVRVRRGPVTVRDLAALYVYDNELYAIEGTGQMVKDALENAAKFFLTCPDAACSHGPLVNRAIIGYQFDMAQGVQYEIDLTKPVGQRIENLRRNGKPLAPGEKLRIAVNNYRYGGSGGYSMFRKAKILWESSQDIRNLMIEYFIEHRKLPERPDGNWRVVPPAALATLEREAAEAER